MGDLTGEYAPTNSFVTGGGWIWDSPKSKGNFGFNVKTTKNGFQGHSTYVYREGEWDVIVKSTSWVGGGFWVDPLDTTHAVFEAKCVVQKSFF